MKLRTSLGPLRAAAQLGGKSSSKSLFPHLCPSSLNRLSTFSLSLPIWQNGGHSQGCWDAKEGNAAGGCSGRACYTSAEKHVGRWLSGSLF